jgi:hypothetical protein
MLGLSCRSSNPMVLPVACTTVSQGLTLVQFSAQRMHICVGYVGYLQNIYGS